MLNGLLQRQGGKYYYRKKIIDSFPNDYDIYVEPFIGGGSILLNAPIKKKMFGSDSDPKVIETYQLMKKVPTSTIQDFDFSGGRERFYQIREFQPTTDAEKLYKLLYLNKKSFMGHSKVPTSTISARTGSKFFKDLEKVKERLKKINISKRDYKNAILKHDSPKTFFYLDPPYYQTDVSAYETGNIDHQELRKILGEVKGKFLMSHNDTPFIRELYADFRFTPMTTTQADVRGGTREVSEVLISNY